MSGSGKPGDSTPSHNHFDNHFNTATDWFTPVPHSQIGLLERPSEQTGPDLTGPHTAVDEPIIRDATRFSDDPRITDEDVYAALGPDADELLESANVDVDELIQLINAETTVIPPLVLPEEAEEQTGTPPPVAQAVKSWKSKFLKGTIATIIVSLSGAGTAIAAMDKTVTLEVDGHERTINTYESTVGEALEEEGIAPGPHDAISPSPREALDHGETISLDRGRQVQLTVDGETRTEWVRSINVGEALQKFGVPTENSWTSANLGTAIPTQGMPIEIKTQKAITVFDGGNAPRQLDTNAVTVQELLDNQGLNLGPQDKVTPGSDLKITEGAQVHITRIGTTVVNDPTPIDPPVQRVADSSMPAGQEKVVSPGAAGEKVVTARVTTENKQEVGRDILGERVVREPQARVVHYGTQRSSGSSGSSSAPAVSGGGVWDRLAQCESGGNWSTNSGNGYYGGVQFDKQTWSAYGGDQYAALPHQASREEQIAIASKVRDARGGYGAWPSCASKLGLPR